MISFTPARMEAQKNHTPGEKPQDPGFPTAAGVARLIPHSSTRKAASEYTALCSTCNSVFDQLASILAEPDGDLYRAFNPGFVHHASKSALEHAASSHCSLCRLFTERSLSSHEQPPQSSSFNVGFWIEETGSPITLHHHLTHMAYRAAGEEQKSWYEVNFVAEKAGYESRIRQIPLIAPLKTAIEWIQECNHFHKDCQRSETTTLPTRLLEVGETDNVKLLVTAEDLPSHTTHRPYPYLALSHCWGSSTPKSRLTTENLKSFRSGVPIASLENTLRDAVQTTRALGYKYLWADTLCILQDSPTDWQNECSRMEDLYSNSDVTLAAVAATHGNIGFLDSRARLVGSACEIRLAVESEHVGHLTVQLLNGVTNQMPLAMRAWAFQEQLLSPRILSFGRYQMYFQCHSGHKSETSIQPYENPVRRTIEKSPMLPQWLTGIPCKNITLRSPPCSFYDLVNQYSRRDLTYGDDVLPALSGISRRYGLVTGDDYLAGLWREDLLRGLCWVTTTDAKRRPQQNFRVPSWSWASVRARTRWDYSLIDADEADVHRYAAVMSASVVRVGLDPFGQVDGGEVTVRGRAQEVVCSGDPDLYGGLFRIAHPTGGRIPLYFHPDDEDVDKLLPDSQVITALSILNVKYSKGRNFYALALVPAKDNSEIDCFRRIGLIESYSDTIDWTVVGEERTVRII